MASSADMAILVVFIMTVTLGPVAVIYFHGHALDWQQPGSEIEYNDLLPDGSVTKTRKMPYFRRGQPSYSGQEEHSHYAYEEDFADGRIEFPVESPPLVAVTDYPEDYLSSDVDKAHH